LLLIFLMIKLQLLVAKNMGLVREVSFLDILLFSVSSNYEYEVFVKT